MFYIYDIPPGQSRGGHAHRVLDQVLICLAGGFDAHVDDSVHALTIRLDRPWLGLYVPAMIWSSQQNFEPGTVCMVLASEPFDLEDYLHDYEAFVNAAAALRQAG